MFEQFVHFASFFRAQGEKDWFVLFARFGEGRIEVFLHSEVREQGDIWQDYSMIKKTKKFRERKEKILASTIHKIQPEKSLSRLSVCLS